MSQNLIYLKGVQKLVRTFNRFQKNLAIRKDFLHIQDFLNNGQKAKFDSEKSSFVQSKIYFRPVKEQW